MITKISPRIITIRDLVREYYTLKDGALIDKHNELLRIIDIESIKHEKHPHKTFRVYVSRKALKHFIEERKKELSKNNKEADILLKICFIVEQIPEVIVNFDRYEYECEPTKYFYTKYYPGEPSLRILCEPSKNKENSLEICSMHYTKQQKKDI